MKITQAQYHIALGIITLGKIHMQRADDCVRALAELLAEREEDGSGVHTDGLCGDAVYERAQAPESLREVLRKLRVEVEGGTP